MNFPNKILFLIALMFLSSGMKAQFRDPGYSLSVQATYGNRFINYKTDVSQIYKDSIKKADKGRAALGASFLFSFEVRKNLNMYTGLQFQNFGFSRIKSELSFLDTIHPDIGVMNDLSQTGGAYVDFRNRYMYLSLPLLFSNRISPRRSKNTIVHFMYGGTASVLYKHDVKAVFHGFSLRGGIKEKVIEDKQAQASGVNMNLHGGFRIENLVYGKDLWVFVQPELILPVFSANGSRERYHLWAAGLQVGLCYKPVKEKD